MRILIVEDDRSMARLISMLIDPIRREFPGSEVSVVYTFEDAKRIIRGIPPPDCTLLDLSLPPMRLEDTIERLHEIEGFCAIVIVTGHPPDEVRKLLAPREMEIVHKEPSMLKTIFSSMHRAILKFHGKDRIDQSYEEAWDRLRALKTLAITPDGPTR